MFHGSFTFQNDHKHGIISFIKNYTKTENIVGSNIVSIDVPSYSQNSKAPSVIFGINNSNYKLYYSTEVKLSSRYIFFDFKRFYLVLEGISIITDDIDWFEEYQIKTAFNKADFDYSFTITNNNYPELSWQHFSFPITKPCRYINISVEGKTHYSNDNFAVYGMEFFGNVYSDKHVTCIKVISSHALSYASFLFLFLVK